MQPEIHLGPLTLQTFGICFALAFLAVEEGNPGLSEISGRVYVDADGEDETLRALWDETVLRSPVAQSLLRGVPVRVDFKRA